LSAARTAGRTCGSRRLELEWEQNLFRASVRLVKGDWHAVVRGVRLRSSISSQLYSKWGIWRAIQENRKNAKSHYAIDITLEFVILLPDGAFVITNVPDNKSNVPDKPMLASRPGRQPRPLARRPLRNCRGSSNVYPNWIYIEIRRWQLPRYSPATAAKRSGCRRPLPSHRACIRWIF
jgi:hypothetical protein